MTQLNIRQQARPIWMEKPSKPVQVMKVVILVAIAIVMLYPFVYVVSVSLSRSDLVQDGALILWPRHPNLQAYRNIFSTGVVGRAVLVSVGVTLVGTIVSIAMTVALAFGLSRTKDVPGSRFVLLMCLFTLLFGAGIIPNYLLVKALGMLDSYASLIVPGMISAFNLVVLRNFFMSLPPELLDAARVDGANDWRILVSIVVPLSKAVIAVVALFYGVGYWNSFFDALLYLNTPEKWPIQLVLNQYVVQGTPLAGVEDPNAVQVAPESTKMAVLVVATAPILIVYPFLQRYFTKGVLTGAVKQ